jgi:hypothetical protein
MEDLGTMTIEIRFKPATEVERAAIKLIETALCSAGEKTFKENQAFWIFDSLDMASRALSSMLKIIKALLE